MSNNQYTPGTTGWATVLGEEGVYGMWQRRVDGAMFFVLPTPVHGIVSQHWLNVHDFVKEEESDER